MFLGSSGGCKWLLNLNMTDGYDSSIPVVCHFTQKWSKTATSFHVGLIVPVVWIMFYMFTKIIKTRTHTIISPSLQGSRVRAWEAFRELAERRTWLGDFEEPLLGHTDPSLGQRWLWRGQENTQTRTCDALMEYLILLMCLSTPQRSHYLSVSWPNTKIVILFTGSWSHLWQRSQINLS